MLSSHSLPKKQVSMCFESVQNMPGLVKQSGMREISVVESNYCCCRHENMFMWFLALNWFSQINLVSCVHVLNREFYISLLCVLAERRKWKSHEHPSIISKPVPPVRPRTRTGVRSLHQHRQKQHQRTPDIQKSHYQWVSGCNQPFSSCTYFL